MTTTRITLADLVVGDVRDRLLRMLSPRTTVAISCNQAPRLPVNLVATALALAESTGGFLRFEDLSTQAQKALLVLDAERRLALDEANRLTPVGERPYLARATEDGVLHLKLQKGIGQNAHLSDVTSYEWIRGIDATRVEIDLSQVEHLNSLLVAWLLQLNQGAGSGRCRLVNVGRQAVAQLTQLRLNHLLAIT